jgi:hypothetical protein
MITNWIPFTSMWFLLTVPALAKSEFWSAVQVLSPGERIEVQLKGAKNRGVLGRVSENDLSMKTKAGELVLSRLEITKVKLRKRNFERRSGIGAAIGTAAGIALGAVAGSVIEGSNPGSAVASGGAVGLGVGAGVGALVAFVPGYYTVYERPKSAPSH